MKDILHFLLKCLCKIKWTLFVLLKCFFIALILFIWTVVAISFAIYVLFNFPKGSEEAQIKQYYKTWFQIPSTGTDVDSLGVILKHSRFSSFKNEPTFVFGNVGDSCHMRTDTFLVFNYQPEDSLFMFRYIDSLAIDTAMNRHTLNFHLYSEKEQPNRTRYWELTYQKVEFDTLYTLDQKVAATHTAIKTLVYTRFPEFSKKYPHHKSERHLFIYDEQLKKFRLSKGADIYYFREKADEWCKYPIIFYK